MTGLPDAILTIIREDEAGWNTLDFERVLALYDADYPDIVYIPEERDTIHGLDELRAYFDSVKAMMRDFDVRFDIVAGDVIGTMAWVHCRGHWSGQNIYRESRSGGIGRVTFVMHRKGNDWKIIHYVESAVNQTYAPPA